MTDNFNLNLNNEKIEEYNIPSYNIIQDQIIDTNPIIIDNKPQINTINTNNNINIINNINNLNNINLNIIDNNININDNKKNNYDNNNNFVNDSFCNYHSKLFNILKNNLILYTE